MAGMWLLVLELRDCRLCFRVDRRSIVYWVALEPEDEADDSLAVERSESARWAFRRSLGALLKSEAALG